MGGNSYEKSLEEIELDLAELAKQKKKCKADGK